MRTQAAATTAPSSTYHQGHEKAGGEGLLTVRGHGGQIIAKVPGSSSLGPKRSDTGGRQGCEMVGERKVRCLCSGYERSGRDR